MTKNVENLLNDDQHGQMKKLIENISIKDLNFLKGIELQPNGRLPWMDPIGKMIDKLDGKTNLHTYYVAYALAKIQPHAEELIVYKQNLQRGLNIQEGSNVRNSVGVKQQDELGREIIPTATVLSVSEASIRIETNNVVPVAVAASFNTPVNQNMRSNQGNRRSRNQQPNQSKQGRRCCWPFRHK